MLRLILQSGLYLEYLGHITLPEISAEQLRLSSLDALHALRYGWSAHMRTYYILQIGNGIC